MTSRGRLRQITISGVFRQINRYASTGTAFQNSLSIVPFKSMSVSAKDLSGRRRRTTSSAAFQATLPQHTSLIMCPLFRPAGWKILETIKVTAVTFTQKLDFESRASFGVSKAPQETLKNGYWTEVPGWYPHLSITLIKSECGTRYAIGISTHSTYLIASILSGI